MMKQYQYKIQWLFPIIVTGDLDNALKIIELLGFRAIRIFYRDINKEIIDEFPTMSYSPTQEETVLKEIQEDINNNKDIYYIELLRK